MSCKRDYPFDFDAGEHFTRVQRARGAAPYPQMIGGVSGLLPLFDLRIAQAASLNIGTGAVAEVALTNTAPYFSDILTPYLRKQT